MFDLGKTNQNFTDFLCVVDNCVPLKNSHSYSRNVETVSVMKHMHIRESECDEKYHNTKVNIRKVV